MSLFRPCTLDLRPGHSAPSQGRNWLAAHAQPDLMHTVEQLRSELGKRKLPTVGLKAELEQRLSAAEQQESKKVRTAMNSIADEWLCPITQELPINPVMAEDGKIYERAAIEEWLRKQQRSPNTGAAMGTKLITSPQVRNTLEHLVGSGAIDGDRAMAWKAKLADERKLQELRAAADVGDADAMYKLGRVFGEGKYGLARNFKQARGWFGSAAELDHVRGMACFGEYLLKGLGGASVPALGLVYSARAAEAGSELADFQLAKAFMKGEWGLPKSSAQARRHILKVVEGEYSHRHLKDASREVAKQLLKELS